VPVTALARGGVLPRRSLGGSLPPRMNRRAFVVGLGAVLAVPLAAEAQQTRTVRLGWLLPTPKAFAFDAFRQRLKRTRVDRGQ
jgi:hypothetical protein